MAKFRLLAGKHSEGGRLWVRGDVFESKSDLLKLNTPTSRKFEQVSDDSRTAEGVVIGTSRVTVDVPKSQGDPETLQSEEYKQRARSAVQSSSHPVPNFPGHIGPGPVVVPADVSREKVADSAEDEHTRQAPQTPQSPQTPHPQSVQGRQQESEEAGKTAETSGVPSASPATGKAAVRGSKEGGKS